MAGVISNLIQKVLPPKKPKAGGTSHTPTYNPQNTANTLSLPQYQEHLQDIFTTRSQQDSRALLNELFRHDSDISATVNAYLTLSDKAPTFLVYDANNQLDRPGLQTVHQILSALQVRTDYSKGFQRRPSLRELCEEFRYMLLLRGGIAAELVFDKLLVPAELRNVDLSTIRWRETAPGVLIPEQVTPNNPDPIILDSPAFFVAFYRRNPTSLYTYSHFVSAINTIAARQQVINDLYRIMQKVGFPRIDVKVVEEVLRKNAPAEQQADENKMREWLNSRLAEVNTTISGLQPNQAFVHFDSVETGTINKEGPGKAMDVTAVINVLNAQNQAALKTMASVIGRGESGVNTASTETRMFALNADTLNGPIADILAKALTLALRMTGSESRVEVVFPPSELRPELELEPQKLVKQTRLLALLSDGIITDDEFHIQMFGRPRPDNVPELAGTKFLAPAAGGPEAEDANVNGQDPAGRAITSDNPNAAKSNAVKAAALLRMVASAM
jgi:hypothetical protein